MAKFLQEILGENYLQELLEVYTPFPEDERRFYEKHGLELGKEGEPPIKFPRFENMYSENGKYNADHLFNGVIKVYDREKDNYGYSYGKDAEYYEEYVDEETKPGKRERWMINFEKKLPDRNNINWDHAIYHYNKGSSPTEAARTHTPLKPKPFGSGMKVKR